MRTNFYVDGFNLYKGLLAHTPHKWLDLVAFCRFHFPEPGHILGGVKYFTARVKPAPDDKTQPARQDAYLKALTTFPDVETIFGQFKTTHEVRRLSTSLPEPHHVLTKVTVALPKEKGSDVNLASHLIVDAALDCYDAAVVVTNDPDQKVPIHLVRTHFNKTVIVLSPIRDGRFASNDLRGTASDLRIPDSASLTACQLPPFLLVGKKHIHKPREWHIAQTNT